MQCTPPDTAAACLLAAEADLFLKEYQQHYSAGETKPQQIGMPFFLHAPGSDTGVLLIHGLMAAPEEVREWAEFLHQKGLTVYAPRLAGHGTSCKDLSTRRYEDWLDSAERGHAILKNTATKFWWPVFPPGRALHCNPSF